MSLIEERRHFFSFQFKYLSTYWCPTIHIKVTTILWSVYLEKNIFYCLAFYYRSLFLPENWEQLSWVEIREQNSEKEFNATGTRKQRKPLVFSKHSVFICRLSARFIYVCIVFVLTDWQMFLLVLWSQLWFENRKVRSKFFVNIIFLKTIVLKM